MKKVKRDGKVAVLISKGFGSGWYTWNNDFPQCLFSPEIVELIESGRQSEITYEYCKELFGGSFYAGGLHGLTVEWVPEGTAFTINDYDGNESLETIDSLTIIA